MIHTTISGRLGRDATAKQVNGKQVIEFTVAVDKGWGDKKTTLWIDCSYWNEKTGLTPYLIKGAQVLVLGESDVRVFTTKEGAAKGVMTLRVDRVELVGSKSQASTGNSSTERATVTPIDEPIDDLPF